VAGGIGALPGAAIGAGVGAATGAFTSPNAVDLGKPVWE
jgi:osmotically inducible lipoprotein OsmB